MQNAMLDSIVPSNSQELFNFNAEHNGEACIESLKPEDAHTPNAFRFTIAMLCTIYAVPKQTMHDNIDSLLEDEEIAQSDISYYAIPGGNNRTYETALYNLNVLNRLGMCCFRKNKEAKKVRNKFNDVLVERETGGYGIRNVDDMINDPDTAIRLLTQLKILRLQNKQLAMERDEAIRTKSMIGSRREATAMNTASQKSKECAKLTTGNAELKDAVGRGSSWRTVAMMRAEWKREFGHAPDWHKLMKFSSDLPTGMQPAKDVEEKVILSNGREKINLLFRYHREAWAKYREYEENLRVSSRSCRDAKILYLRADHTEIEYF